MSRAFTAVLFLLAFSGCAVRGTAPAVPPARAETTRLAAISRLGAELESIFTSPALDHANWGVKFESLETGETLYALNPFKFLLPASNQKLLSSAVAAERLGWDFYFTTQLFADGEVDEQGTLHGDLVITSDGDPTINPRHDSRWGVFDMWAYSLKAGGLHTIDGRIIGDDNAFAEPGLGAGWTWENLAYGFGTTIGALQYNENQVVVSVTPGAIGAAPTVTVTPPYHGMIVETTASTVPAGSNTTIDLARLPGSKVLRVVGDIAADSKPVTITASIENPTELYVRALKAALERQGITVTGKAVDIDDTEPRAGENRRLLLVDYSPPLREIIDVCLKWSRNEYAETLLRIVAPRGQPLAAQDALDVMRGQLEEWSIPRTLVVPADGSGLSRQDYVTAHGLTMLLTYLWMDPKHADVFRSTLPVAGVSGTLAERMNGTPLEGRVWAKTGTLSNVRSLSGYLLTRAGEPIVFSMLSNNFQVPTSTIDLAMEEALVRVFELPRSQ